MSKACSPRLSRPKAARSGMGGQAQVFPFQIVNDDAFIARFEQQGFSLDQWHHREHIKIAYLYLLQSPLDEATERLKSGIKALNARHKVPDALDRGYHETMTQAWMRLVHCTLCEFGSAETADAFVDKHTQLLSKRALLFFYSRDRIMSAESKRGFIEPDLAPLPVSARLHKINAQANA